MQGEEQQKQQTEAEAKPGRLEYSKPEKQLNLSLWVTACLVAVLHFFITTLAMATHTQGRAVIYSPPQWMKLVALFPMSTFGAMLNLFNWPPSQLLAAIGILMCIANSLFWGFAIALLIYWLKRRRMRRM